MLLLCPRSETEKQGSKDPDKISQKKYIFYIDNEKNNLTFAPPF